MIEDSCYCLFFFFLSDQVVHATYLSIDLLELLNVQHTKPSHASRNICKVAYIQAGLKTYFPSVICYFLLNYSVTVRNSIPKF